MAQGHPAGWGRAGGQRPSPARAAPARARASETAGWGWTEGGESRSQWAAGRQGEGRTQAPGKAAGLGKGRPPGRAPAQPWLGVSPVASQGSCAGLRAPDLTGGWSQIRGGERKGLSYLGTELPADHSLALPQGHPGPRPAPSRPAGVAPDGLGWEPAALWSAGARKDG